VGKQERAELTVDKILGDIDWTHIAAISKLHWLQTLITFVPSLHIHHQAVTAMFQAVVKHQINPTRHSKVHPLGTNSANETSTQGMKDALADFLEQLGVTAETYEKQIMFFTGDGKSFEGMGKVKKYLSGHVSDYKSLRFICLGLELWHTKWTDLSRICNTHWGSAHDKVDPSTLGFLAHAIASPKPANLKKVDFYPNF
jgi:hypothetical protein